MSAFIWKKLRCPKCSKTTTYNIECRSALPPQQERALAIFESLSTQQQAIALKHLERMQVEIAADMVAELLGWSPTERGMWVQSVLAERQSANTHNTQEGT